MTLKTIWNTVLVAGLLAVGAASARGAGAAETESALSEDKPFAEAHIIMQVSDADPVHYQAVLDIANNLTKHYGGSDMVDIEVIAFGVGVPMLLAHAGTPDNNDNAQRISSLIEHGVRFYVCGNTLDTLERKTGKKPVVLDGVIRVQTGVAFMIDEIRRGYLPLHP
ncbi:MAG: DsrE family protein [Gammaproteobacteria bacterium]|nr:DsrE family protein [Gammaproteobacteria bacterium]